MRAAILGYFFAGMAIVFWEDERLRLLHIILANIWWASAFIAQRRERK